MEVGLWVEEEKKRKVDARQGRREPNVVDIAAGAVLNHDGGEERADCSGTRSQDCVSGREERVNNMEMQQGRSVVYYPAIIAARSWRKKISETIPGTILCSNK